MRRDGLDVLFERLICEYGRGLRGNPASFLLLYSTGGGTMGGTGGRPEVVGGGGRAAVTMVDTRLCEGTS